MPLAVTGGILAAGALGAGIGLVVVREGELNNAKQLGMGLGSGACVNPSTVCTNIQNSVRSAETLGNASIAMFVVGGAFTIATIVVAAVPSGGNKKTTLRLTPSLAGLLIHGSF